MDRVTFEQLPQEYRDLFLDIQRLELEVEQLGAIAFSTSDGCVFRMYEQALTDSVPAQKEFNDAKRELDKKKDRLRQYDNAFTAIATIKELKPETIPLRDMLAAAVMTGLTQIIVDPAAQRVFGGKDQVETMVLLARAAYRQADAMLKVREI